MCYVYRKSPDINGTRNKSPDIISRYKQETRCIKRESPIVSPGTRILCTDALRLEQFLASFGHMQYPSLQKALFESVDMLLQSSVSLHGIGVSITKSVISERICVDKSRRRAGSLSSKEIVTDEE
jgi:hypothetical protein